MRVNPTMASPGDLPKGKDKNPARYVRGGAVLSPKREGATPPPVFSHLKSKDTYIPGMGEVRVPVRPGADNHLQIKSVGFRT